MRVGHLLVSRHTHCTNSAFQNSSARAGNYGHIDHLAMDYVLHNAAWPRYDVYLPIVLR